MRELIPGVGFCLMVATMLHSIASGNLLPAWVKVACVDINPATVTKLMDRGSTQTVGVVTDAEPFLRALGERTGKERLTIKRPVLTLPLNHHFPMTAGLASSPIAGACPRRAGAAEPLVGLVALRGRGSGRCRANHRREFAEAVFPVPLLVAVLLRLDEHIAVGGESAGEMSPHTRHRPLRNSGGGRKSPPAQNGLGSDLVDVLPPWPAGAHEAPFEFIVRDANAFGHFQHRSTSESG